MRNFAIGVDIGGSHITAAAVDLDLKTVIRTSKQRHFVNSADEAGKIIRLWCDVIQSVIPGVKKNEMKIGIAMPGPFDYELGVSLISGLAKYENLYGLNVKRLIADVIGITPQQILMNNDAACFLHGEMFAGAGRGCSNSIGITLGTGTGTAIHRDGVTHDANLGPSPFLNSIADNYLSTRWFVNEYLIRTGNKVDDVRSLVALYHTEQIVRDIFSIFSKNLGLFLKEFIQRGNPRILVMGGNIAQASNLFLPETENVLRENGINIPIMKAILGEDATILGGASLFSTASTRMHIV